MTAVYIDFMQTPIELPDGVEKWIICRSFDDFVKVILELKSVPDIISLGGPLNKKAIEWCLNPDNVQTNDLYQDSEAETVLKCLVFLYHTCKKNNLVYKKIYLHGEDTRLNNDIFRFVNQTSKEMGITPPTKVHQWAISPDYEKEPNYQIFKECLTEN